MDSTQPQHTNRQYEEDLRAVRAGLLKMGGLVERVIPRNSTIPRQSTTFSGNQGLLLNDNSGVGSAAIWHANGHLYGLAGSLKATDLRKIADSLGTPH